MKFKKGDEEKRLHDTLVAIDMENPTADLKDVDAKEYKMGMQTEGEEHQDIAHGDMLVIHKIVMAHLKENKKYYSKLKEMEKEDEESEEVD